MDVVVNGGIGALIAIAVIAIVYFVLRKIRGTRYLSSSQMALYGTVAITVTLISSVAVNQMDPANLRSTSDVTPVDRMVQSATSDVANITDETEVKQETTTEMVAFSVQHHSDPSLKNGEQRQIQAGRHGERTVVYKVTYVNGKERTRTVFSDTVTTQPLPEIIAVGASNTIPNSNSSERAKELVRLDSRGICLPGTSVLSEFTRGYHLFKNMDDCINAGGRPEN